MSQYLLVLPSGMSLRLDGSTLRVESGGPHDPPPAPPPDLPPDQPPPPPSDILPNCPATNLGQANFLEIDSDPHWDVNSPLLQVIAFKTGGPKSMPYRLTTSDSVTGARRIWISSTRCRASSELGMLGESNAAGGAQTIVFTVGSAAIGAFPRLRPDTWYYWMIDPSVPGGVSQYRATISLAPS